MPAEHNRLLASWHRLRGSLAHDLGASLVVFLVAVPLSMGIALASGAPIGAGFIAAVIGGVVCGLLSGAPLQVSGPAAGLSVVVFGFLQQHHDFRVLCAIVVLAGILQILMGLSRIARLALAISPAVIHGMMAGIGVLIALGQLHVVLGGTPQSSAWHNLRELPGQLAKLHGPATALGLLTGGLFLTWPVLTARRPLRLLRSVPAALVAVLVATVVSLPAEVPRVKVASSLFATLHLPAFDGASWWALLSAGVTVGLIASAESLLCAIGTDKLHSGPRANLDRELMAQGVGNVLSGLIGGLPITGVMVRSKACIDAGARTRLATILHGLWVLLFVSQLGFLISRIPASVLAGLLVVVGLKLIHIPHIRAVNEYREAPIYFVTLIGVVAINLLAGIGLGIATALVLLIRRRCQVDIHVAQEGGSYQVNVRGPLTFLAVPRLTAQLAAVPPGSQVLVELAADYIDHAGVEALRAFTNNQRVRGGQVTMSGPPSRAFASLAGMN